MILFSFSSQIDACHFMFSSYELGLSAGVCTVTIPVIDIAFFSYLLRGRQSHHTKQIFYHLVRNLNFQNISKGSCHHVILDVSFCGWTSHVIGSWHQQITFLICFCFSVPFLIKFSLLIHLLLHSLFFCMSDSFFLHSY